MTKTIAAALAGLALSTVHAVAAPLKLPQGMGGVPDIGAIPCEVFSNMLVVGSKGTRLSLLTWAEGYYFAKSGKSLDEILVAETNAAENYDFQSLTDHFVAYCAANPEAVTREAVVSLGDELLR